jgi:exosortase
MSASKRLRTSAGVVILATAFGPALWRLIDVGRTNEYAGHAAFVPLVSAIVAWSDRDRLRAVAGPGDWRGLPLIAAALGVLGLGYATGNLTVQGLALPFAAAGLVLWLWGIECLRAATFPVWFLAMIVPPPNALVAAVTGHLQAFAAAFATAGVRLVGIPIHQVGNQLELRFLTLDVAEACNGLRFLLAIMVLTAAFGQVTLPNRRRRIVLVAAAAAIAIVANAVRVAAIAIGVHYFGPDAASGTIHDWIGKGVWAMTLLPLIGVGLVLARWPRRLTASPLVVTSKTEFT